MGRFCLTTPSLLVQLISQLSRVVITEIPRAFFLRGLPDHFHSRHVECLSAKQFPRLSLRAAELQGLLGLVSALWFGSSGWLSQQERLDPFSLQPTHVCVCPGWGQSTRTAGVTSSQTALDGPRQAVRINNLLRL